MLVLSDLLIKCDLSPADVNVVRHRTEIPLRSRFPWIASEKPDLFEYYQSTQSPTRERMLERRSYLASFVGMENGETIFVGVYRKRGARRVSKSEFEADERFQRLSALGCLSYPEEERLFFEFEELEDFRIYKGRLFIGWGEGHRSFIQVADHRKFPITRLSVENELVAELSHPSELLLSVADIRELPAKWRDRISQWRGIYLITDISDGARYVGSAYGVDNLWQRWSEYSISGHGGDALLKTRDAANFRFSVLQLLSPTEEIENVLAMEAGWKRRLLTHRADWGFGLNAN